MEHRSGGILLLTARLFWTMLRLYFAPKRAESHGPANPCTLDESAHEALRVLRAMGKGLLTMKSRLFNSIRFLILTAGLLFGLSNSIFAVRSVAVGNNSVAREPSSAATPSQRRRRYRRPVRAKVVPVWRNCTMQRRNLQLQSKPQRNLLASWWRCGVALARRP